MEAIAEGKGSIQMKRQINRLTAAQVRTARRGTGDGAGLWLQFDPKHETRSWLYRYTCPIYRKADSMGFGSAMLTSLARARELRAEAYDILRRAQSAPRARRQDRATPSKTARPRRSRPSCNALTCSLMRKRSSGTNQARRPVAALVSWPEGRTRANRAPQQLAH